MGKGAELCLGGLALLLRGFLFLGFLKVFEYLFLRFTVDDAVYADGIELFPLLKFIVLSIVLFLLFKYLTINYLAFLIGIGLAQSIIFLKLIGIVLVNKMNKIDKIESKDITNTNLQMTNK